MVNDWAILVKLVVLVLLRLIDVSGSGLLRVVKWVSTMEHVWGWRVEVALMRSWHKLFLSSIHIVHVLMVC